MSKMAPPCLNSNTVHSEQDKRKRKNVAEAAAHIAKSRYRKYLEKVRQKSPQAYFPWTQDEDEQLLSLFVDRMAISEIAQRHRRSEGAINSRIVRLAGTSAPARQELLRRLDFPVPPMESIEKMADYEKRPDPQEPSERRTQIMMRL